MDIYPAIDLINGKCVRLWKGQYDKVTTFADAPADIARRYARAGARVLHLVDLDGARVGTASNLATLQAIAQDDSHDLTIQWGGGLRTTDSVESALHAGASRVVVGSTAVRNPALVGEWVVQFGVDRIVVALDVRRSAAIGGKHEDDYEPAIAGWVVRAERTLWDLVDELADLGVSHFLSTDIDRDGTKSGPNLDLYRQFVGRYPTPRVQASGGVSSESDLAQLGETGVAAVVVGRTLLDGTLKPEALFC